MKEDEPSVLKDKYVDAAKRYGEAIIAGDVRKSDLHYDEVEALFDQLKNQGIIGLKMVSMLLLSDDEGVRLWASAHLLNYPEYDSVSVLERLTKSSSLLALTAEVTLDKWRNGKISY